MPVASRIACWARAVLSMALAWMGAIPGQAVEPATGESPQTSIRKLSFAPPAGMTRADLYIVNTAASPRAVLLLCPGFNGNGEELVRQAAWQDFARTSRLGLCALSFASPGEETLARRGYYLAAHGSGEVLLNGLRRGFGADLPILAYGFSGGAHFTASLVNWNPERVLGWCAYSAAWWEEPALRPAATPPGIVACGDADAARYGASLTFFAQGRAMGRPWTWVSLGGTEHARSAPLDQFVRAYFASLLSGILAPDGVHAGRSQAAIHSAGEWRDVDTKQKLSIHEAMLQPTLACWLPDPSLGVLWNSLHHP